MGLEGGVDSHGVRMDWEIQCEELEARQPSRLPDYLSRLLEEQCRFFENVRGSSLAFGLRQFD